jgi:stage V sporulation protein SpoVS
MGAPLTPPLIEPEQGARRGQFDVIRGDSGILLRVKHTTDIKLLAASISFALVGNQRVTLRAVGAPAVNALLKSAAVARQYVAVRGLDLYVRPGFETLMLPSRQPGAKPGDKEEVTAIICHLTAQ